MLLAITRKVKMLTHFLNQDSNIEKVKVDRPENNSMKKETKTKDNIPCQQHRPVLGLLVPSGLLSHDFLIILVSVFLTLTTVVPKISHGQAVHSVGGDGVNWGPESPLYKVPWKTGGSS